MAAPFLTRKRQVAIKVESTEGTAESLAAADADILAYEPELNFDIDIFNRNPARSTLSTLPGLPGREFGSLTFRTELKGSGTATTAPSWAAALLGCGMQEEALSLLVGDTGSGGGTDVFDDGETITGGTSGATAVVVLDTTATTANFNLLLRDITGTFQAAETITGGTSGTTATVDTIPASHGLLYRPLSASPSSVTVALYEDGLRKQLAGARGTFAISAEVGQPAFIEFTFTGKYSSVTDTSLLTGISYESNLPPVFQSAAIKLHDTTNTWLVARSINVDINNTVAPREDANSATGIRSFLITDRDPNGSVDPEGVLVATHDFWTRWRDGTTGIFEFDLGSTAGNRVQVRCQNTSYREIGSGDRTGLATNEVTLGLHTSDVTSAGDDEFYIIHN